MSRIPQPLWMSGLDERDMPMKDAVGIRKKYYVVD